MTTNNQQEQLYRWVKASERLPERGGYYFVMAGSDKATWTRSRLVARTEMLKKEAAENHIEWLEPYTPPVEDGKQGGEVKTDKIKLKLEYKVIHIDGSDEYGKRQSYSKEAELLNDMGNEGWELVSVTASSINYNVYYYFKQSKT